MVKLQDSLTRSVTQSLIRAPGVMRTQGGCSHADPQAPSLEALTPRAGGPDPQEILKQVILESLLESIQLLMVKFHPLPLCRAPQPVFTANTLITSHLEPINRAAPVLSLLCVNKLHCLLIAYRENPAQPGSLTTHALALTCLSRLTFRHAPSFPLHLTNRCLFNPHEFPQSSLTPTPNYLQGLFN